MNNASAPRYRGPRNDKRNWADEPLRGRSGDPGVMDVMKKMGAFTNCWKASHESLKALTPVPNPIRILPQTQVTCR